MFPDVIINNREDFYRNADENHSKVLAAFSNIQEKVRSSSDHEYSLTHEGELSGFCKACEITMGYNLFAAVVGAAVHFDCVQFTGIHFEKVPSAS